MHRMWYIASTSAHRLCLLSHYDLAISHPFHTAPLRTPAGFHQLPAGEIVFTCFISPNRGKVLRLSKAGYAKNHLNSARKGQQWFWKAKVEEQTADFFLIGTFKCQADTAYITKGRSRTSLSNFQQNESTQ